MEERSNINTGLSLGSIGFVIWMVFFILKLCNLDNPSYEWLTWFWVWFPLWAPLAIELVLVSIFIIIYKIITR